MGALSSWKRKWNRNFPWRNVLQMGICLIGWKVCTVNSGKLQTVPYRMALYSIFISISLLGCSYSPWIGRKNWIGQHYRRYFHPIWFDWIGTMGNWTAISISILKFRYADRQACAAIYAINCRNHENHERQFWSTLVSQLSKENASVCIPCQKII